MIVIGAGIAGLTAAHVLKQSAIEVVVVEEADRPGGRLRSFQRDGDTVEMGAQFIHTNYELTLKLCKELGLERELVKMENADALVRGGELHVLPWGGVRISAVGLWSQINTARLLAPILRSRKAMSLERWPELVRYDEEELAGYAGAKLGDEALDYIVRPLMLTYAMAEPEGLSVAYFLRAVSMYLTTDAHCFRGGNDVLAKALARDVDVRAGTRVEELLADGEGRIVGVRTPRGDLEATAVVTAIPAPALRGLYGGWAPEQETFLTDCRYSAFPLTLFEVELPEPPPYWGVVLDRRAGHRVSFVTYPHAKYPGASAPRYLQAWPMGSFGNELLALTDEQIFDAVSAELSRVASLDGAATSPAAVIRYPHAFPHFQVGMFGKAVRFRESEGRPAGLFFAGDYLAGGLIEGAVRSGHSAATRLLASLNR